MGKKYNKKKKRNSDRLLFIIIAIILLAIPVCNVYTKAILSQTNIELEEVKNDIKNQKNIKDSLKMKISELASLDKIQSIATEEGLTYQDGNIKVVTNE